MNDIAFKHTVFHDLTLNALLPFTSNYSNNNQPPVCGELITRKQMKWSEEESFAIMKKIKTEIH